MQDARAFPAGDQYGAIRQETLAPVLQQIVHKGAFYCTQHGTGNELCQHYASLAVKSCWIASAQNKVMWHLSLSE